VEITQLAIGNTAYPLTVGEPLPVQAGQTLRVSCAFNYKVAEETGVSIWASLYKYTAGILNREGNAQTRQIITLEKALTYQPYEGQIDIVIGNVSSGAYGLIVELPDYDVETHIDDCISVSATTGMLEMMAPLLLIGLMAAMAGSMGSMMKKEESK